MASRGRGRPRKPRESRMDAAVDAMKNFGFEEKLIKQTVKELLKVYGGTEAWPLIEDGCYGTLLEVLLKKNEENEGGGEKSKSENEEGGNQLEQALASEQYVDTTPVGNTEPSNDAEPPFSDITDNVSGTDNTGMEESRRGDLNLEATAINSDVNLENTNINLLPTILPPQGPQPPVGTIPNQRHKPTILPPQPPVGTIPNQRREPCYGWISDDGEDIDGIIYLPAIIPEKPRRRSRWDVKPDEL